MKEFSAQCFYGKQIHKDDIEVSKEFAETSKTRYSTIVQHYTEKMLSQQRNKHKRQRLSKKFEPSDETDVLINIINSNSQKLGWKADECLLKKNHGKPCQKDIAPPVNLAQTGTFGDLSNKAFMKSKQTVQKWQKDYESAADIPDSKLPKHYDFRNVNGFDWTHDIRD